MSFDNIDAVTNTSNSEVELLFDISEYKAAKEVITCYSILTGVNAITTYIYIYIQRQQNVVVF